MKLLNTNNKIKISMSLKEWNAIGISAGWIKTAASMYLSDVDRRKGNRRGLLNAPVPSTTTPPSAPRWNPPFPSLEPMSGDAKKRQEDERQKWLAFDKKHKADRARESAQIRKITKQEEERKQQIMNRCLDALRKTNSELSEKALRNKLRQVRKERFPYIAKLKIRDWEILAKELEEKHENTTTISNPNFY